MVKLENICSAEQLNEVEVAMSAEVLKQTRGGGGPLAVDDHIVPEGARWELIGGERVMMSPALEPHGSTHARLAALVYTHVVPGWKVAVDLLTRASVDEDAAPDVSVLPLALDPVTGGRQLEALAFEIVSRQAPSIATAKARALSARGVRRIFMLRLREEPHASYVAEFQHDTATWTRLDPEGEIVDELFVVPLSLRAILEPYQAHNTIARALLAQQTPELDFVIEQERLGAEAERQRAERAEAALDVERQRAEAAEAEREAERQRVEVERLRAEAAEAEGKAERQRAEAERLRAEAAEAEGQAERQRAEVERLRAEAAEVEGKAERQRAEAAETEREAERQRAEALARELELLRALLGRRPDEG